MARVLKELTPPRAASMQREKGGVWVHTLYVEEGSRTQECMWEREGRETGLNMVARLGVSCKLVPVLN